MKPDAEALPLSTEPGVWGRVIWGFNLAFAAGALVFAVAVNGALRRSGDGVLATVLLVLAVGFLPLVAAWVLAAYRRCFWLEGTVLWRRGLRKAQAYDLSTAEIIAGRGRIALAVPPLPRLTVRQAGRRPVTLWLRNRDRRFAPLPAVELEALAAAISTGRENDPNTKPVVDALRAMAADPFNR